MVTPQYVRIVGGANIDVTLSGLEPGTTYRIRVWSTDGTSVSSEAREMDVTTVESGEVSLFCSASFPVVEVDGFDPICHQALCPLRRKAGMEVQTG